MYGLLCFDHSNAKRLQLWIWSILGEVRVGLQQHQRFEIRTCSQSCSDVKIKKKSYGPYDYETDDEEQPEEKVKSNNLDVKIEEKDTDNE